MKAVLALEDGTSFEGISVGAGGVASGEVVFNTGMTGYQEILTDPSYAGQIVTMTCPEIGNYGVAADDVESRAPRVSGFVMRQTSPVASNWRASGTLGEYLVAHGVVAIAGIDTRALTRRLRSVGAMRGVLAAGDWPVGELVDRARQVPSMVGADLVQTVTCATPFTWPPEGAVSGGGGYELDPVRRPGRRLRVAAYDFGMKWNILRRFAAHGCEVQVFPATAPAETLLASRPDGVFLSNGPGDPAALHYAIDHVRGLIRSEVPVFGICLGHQLLGLALDGRTFKLKFGHRGSNHPVKQVETGRVEITSQNHGFAVDPSSLPDDVVVTHVNLYDQTLEGFRHRTRPLFSVQYHPEASPGPHDADYLFGLFLDEMERRR
ncbi:MAG: glutamine-hydrolyzing carbamoyl-phosphate synthase small subunit [Acidobacteriota bacterium]